MNLQRVDLERISRDPESLVGYGTVDDAGWVRILWKKKNVAADVRFEETGPRGVRAAEIRFAGEHLRKYRDFPLTRIEASANAALSIEVW